MSNFALLETIRGEENPVKIPRACKNTRGPHVFDTRINPATGAAVGYRPLMPNEIPSSDYPKMLFHPKFGAKPKPEPGKYTVGCVTADQYQQALATYQEALKAWDRDNRTKVVEDAEEEERLVKIGWLRQPPVRKSSAAFDPNSDEI